MDTELYNFKINLNWKLINQLSQIDRFDASWTALEKREQSSLKNLKSFATIQSVGASTRIEGSKMSDDEVKALIDNMDISKIENRDSQEVAGYFNVLNILTESPTDIRITGSTIKNLHNQLMKFSKKDDWHKGDYKQHSNAVEANFPDGSRQIIFRTTEPGYATEDAMSSLIRWHNTKSEVHQLLKDAAFIYEFLSIHPFQDGNGRLSRLLSTLLLLQSNYGWIQYVSFEHEIENNKKNYYSVLRNCQAQRPNENISEWIDLFLNSLTNIQIKLMKKLEVKDSSSKLAPRDKSIYLYIMNNPGTKSGEISEKLDIPNPTTKRVLSQLVQKELVEKFGKGAGTNYAIK